MGRTDAGQGAGLVVGHHAAIAFEPSEVRKRERAGGDPPLEDVVGESAGCDRRIAITQPRGFLKVARENRQAAPRGVRLLAQRPVGECPPNELSEPAGSDTNGGPALAADAYQASGSCVGS